LGGGESKLKITEIYKILIPNITIIFKKFCSSLLLQGNIGNKDTQHKGKSYPSPWDTQAHRGTTYQILELQSESTSVFINNFKPLMMTNVS
jgi:hypothetical protein